MASEITGLLDLTPAERETASVFFVCHDPPVVLFQSSSLAAFLREWFRMFSPPHASLVDDVQEDRPFNVWRTNLGEIDHDAALAADADLRAFATELGDQFVFVDLRESEIGMGFSWGRFGPRTHVVRHGYERLFAYRRPDERQGLSSPSLRLAGREDVLARVTDALVAEVDVNLVRGWVGEVRVEEAEAPAGIESRSRDRGGDRRAVAMAAVLGGV